MSEFVKIAVDAMGGDNSPEKIIDGIIHNHKKDSKNFFKIFGDKNKIKPLIDNKIKNDFYEIIHTENSVLSTDSPLEAAKKGSFVEQTLMRPNIIGHRLRVGKDWVQV